MKQRRRNCFLSVTLLSAFVIWTLLVRFVDVREIGPQGSSVGFATLNAWVHGLTGANMWLYHVTDWLGLVPIAVAFAFACLGVAQWIKRKSLMKVDRSIWALGGFYLAVMAVFVFFEFCVVNYRPVLIEGYPEASYPSSTTLLVMCVMPTASMQMKCRINRVGFRRCAIGAIWLFVAFMVLGRLISGVHWLTDIIGGALISAALVTAYASVAESNA